MPSNSIVYVDSRVANYQSLIDSLNEPYEVFVLDGDKDGLDQMAGYLKGRSGLEAIHVISHGSQGALYLGSTVLNSGNLARYETQLGSIGGSLTLTGDILLYGCNVAQGDVGVQFITSLAQVTGADVLGSDDVTGRPPQGGNGVLEYATGKVATAVLALDNLTQILSTNTAPTYILSDGKVTTDIGSLSRDTVNGVTLQADGKILVAGTSYTYNSSKYDFALVRYNADGSLDTTFSNDGKVTTDIGSSSDDYGLGVTLQADGKILVAGQSGLSTRISLDFALVRYNADGGLDTTFSNDGKVTTDFGSSSNIGYSSVDIGKDVTLQADGKILVVGNSTYGNFALVRYNADGSLDTTFSNDGKVSTDIGSSSEDVGNGVTLQADGKILVAGTSYTYNGGYEFAVVRHNADGSLDTTFSNDGKVTTDIGSSSIDKGNGVTLQADGKILVAGQSNNDFALVRYNADGSLDTTFSNDGKVITDFGSSSYGFGLDVTLQADGKILVAGQSSPAGQGSLDFALVRYNPDGSLDTTFSNDGKVTTDIESLSYNLGLGMTLLADGKILVAGQSNSDFALVRYNADGSLDTTFSPPENTLQQRAPARYAENSSAAILAPAAQILDVELAASGNYNGATLTLARNGGVNAQDVFSVRSGGTLSGLVQGSYFSVDSVTIGRVVSIGNGLLSLAFNNNATQSLVNKALQQIAYANTSDAPPATVQIDWTFSDGNTGAQGTGGALSVTGSTTVQITATNDAPVLKHSLVDQNLSANTRFSYTFAVDSFTDPDLEALNYIIRMSDGTGVPPWLTFTPSTRTFSGNPGVADAGHLDIVVAAVDSANATASYIVRLSVSTTPGADTTAPTVTGFSPADEATGVMVGSNFDFNFSETIVRGTGNIVLKNGTGATVATYDAATSNNLSMVGNVLSINPTTDLAYNTGYVVEFAIGSIKDLKGNSFAGMATYNFTTAITVPDTTAPTVATFNPMDESTGVVIASDIVFTFSEAIANGTGNIVLKTAAGVTVAAYNADASSNLSLAGSVLTINPTADLAYSTEYRIEFAAGTIKDIAGNSFAGTTSYNFTTKAAPEPDKVLTGGGTNDSFTTGTGNDSIDGGVGIDTVMLNGSLISHTLTKTASGWMVSSSSGGIDTLQNVERLKFSDTMFALDIDGNGGQAYRVYQAAFNRTPDAGGLGFWIKTMDGGASLRSVAEGFAGSAEFKALYGSNPTNAQIVTKLYDNVLHRPGETGGFNFWLGVLDSKADTLAGVLAAFSESAENQAGLVGVIGNGFVYTPFV